jgi:hypothetical protein
MITHSAGDARRGAIYGILAAAERFRTEDLLSAICFRVLGRLMKPPEFDALHTAGLVTTCRYRTK